METLLWCAGTGLMVAAWAVLRLRPDGMSAAAAVKRLMSIGGGTGEE
jgi:hypothetical protein